MRIEKLTQAMRCARRTVSVASAAWLVFASSANAQNARVYVANATDARVLQVQFEPPGTDSVIDDFGLLTEVRDLAIRDDGLDGSHLIVCDAAGGRIAFFANSSGAGQLIFDVQALAGPQHPDGISLDPAGDIFVLSSGVESDRQVWAIKRDPSCPGGPQCVPGGYRTPLGLIDPNVQIHTQIDSEPTTLETVSISESQVVLTTSGILQAGDLLVLTNPGALVRYQAVQLSAFLATLALGQTPAPLVPETIIHPADASVPLDRQFPGGAIPQSMAVGPSGELLVAMSDGRVLIFGTDGHRKPDGLGGFVDLVDLASSAGSGDYKLAVGLQDSKNRAFLSFRQQGVLRRYTFAPDGSVFMDSSVSGFLLPMGVDASNSATSTTPPGDDVVVSPSSVLTTQIEHVVQEGLITEIVTTFPDPREREQSIPPHLPLHRSLYLDELRADLPHIEIPAWARAFRLGDPNIGTPSFILIEADSNAVVSGVLDHLADETPILGYDPDCADPDVTKQPFLFWAPDANDAPIVEGAKFIDVSTGCGSIRGMTRGMSYFIAGVRITEPLKTLVQQKLNGLRKVIQTSHCIDPLVAFKLLNIEERAEKEFARGRYAKAIESLEQLVALVLQYPEAFAGCEVNVEGELRARSHSAIYILHKLP